MASGAGGRPRWAARIAVLAAIVAVLSPVARNRDSFPLSTYPMYAGARREDAVINTAVGVDAAGRMHRLSPSVIALTDDPLIAESQVRGAIRSGRAGVLCQEIARRAADRLAAVEIDIVEEHHDLGAKAAGRESLRRRSQHARSAVAR